LEDLSLRQNMYSSTMASSSPRSHIDNSGKQASFFYVEFN